MFIIASTTIPTILPAWVVPLLPLAVSAITGIFQHADAEHLQAQLINALIAALFFLLGTIVLFVLSGPISSDLNFDALVYLALLGLLLQSPPCKALYQAVLIAIPSPLKALFELLGKQSDTTVIVEQKESEDKP